MTDETVVNEPASEPSLDDARFTVEEGSSALSIDDFPSRDTVKEPAREAEPEEQDQKSEGVPTGYKQVDFQNDSREDIEARFHRLYGQMKRQSAMLDQMAQDNRTLYEKMNNFEVAQTATNIQSHMGSLQAQLQDAMDNGDAARTSAIIRQISQLESRAAQPPRQPQHQQQEMRTLEENPEVVAIREWANERPWAQEGHAHRNWAAFTLNELYTSPEWADRPVSEKLAEVERQYKQFSGSQTKQQSAPAQAAVLDQGQQTRRRTGKGPQLSDGQKAVAVRMFPDKSRDEAYAMYAKGL